MDKSACYVISTDPCPLRGDLWTDDNGGSLFVSKDAALDVVFRNQLNGVHVVPCGLDEDLARMTALYCG